MNRATPVNPWYREPWPWLLAAGPVAVVLAGIATTVIAFTSFDGLVADDYYKRGLAINRELAREQKAADLGMAVTVNHDRATGRVEVALRQSESVRGLPASVRVKFVHPVKAERDVERILPSVAPGRYAGDLGPLDQVRLSIMVEGVDWRVSGPFAGGNVVLEAGQRK